MLKKKTRRFLTAPTDYFVGINKGQLLRELGTVFLSLAFSERDWVRALFEVRTIGCNGILNTLMVTVGT